MKVTRQWQIEVASRGVPASEILVEAGTVTEAEHKALAEARRDGLLAPSIIGGRCVAEIVRD